MNSRASSEVEIELITTSFRLLGGSPDVDQFKRVSDILNGTDSDLTLTDVTICSLLGVRLEECPALKVAKQDILLAIPKESEDYVAERRMQRVGISTPNLMKISALIMVPPFLARGSLALRSSKDMEAGVRGMNHFFPLLGANLLLEGRLIEEAPVFLINRESVLAIGSQESVGARSEPEKVELSPDRESTLALLAKLRLETEAEEEPKDEPAPPPSWPARPSGFDQRVA